MTRIVVGIALPMVFLRVLGTIVVAVNFATPLHAQTAAIDELRAKIFDAKMVQQTFAGGLAHCSELNGKSFYFQQRNRVLNLDDYHRSLERLALQGAFNPETKRPWNQQDADARWAEVQQLAIKDQANCALVASLPYFEKKLEEMRQQAAASQSNPAANNTTGK
jgi:hypothetical protein